MDTAILVASQKPQCALLSSVGKDVFRLDSSSYISTNTTRLLLSDLSFGLVALDGLWQQLQSQLPRSGKGYIAEDQHHRQPSSVKNRPGVAALQKLVESQAR